MSGNGKDTTGRLQAIMTELLKAQLEESLNSVEGALGRWRSGDLEVFDAHAALLRHAARAERLAERLARVGAENAGSLMRDAFEKNLVGRDEFIAIVGCAPEEVSPSSDDFLNDEKPLPHKRDMVEDLLGNGPILIHVDARNRRVAVPDKFCEDPKLVLRFGYGLTPAIIDLSIDDESISGTLTFSGIPHRCILPWEAVYAVVSEVDQKGMVWPDDVPSAVVAELTGDLQEDCSDEQPPSAKARGSHLKLVK